MESPPQAKRATLPPLGSLLAVCAHPDDESFGLGAALSTFAASGTVTSVLCFTRGEASTLGAATADLGRVRAHELASAADELGVERVELLDYRDGHLDEESLDVLGEVVRRSVQVANADILLVFDEGGIMGHPDHRYATRAAINAAGSLSLPVLAWALPEVVASTLRAEFGVDFVGRGEDHIDFVVRVDRTRQRRAIDRHVSQASDNPVLARRLDLMGDFESFRWLSCPDDDFARAATDV